MQPINNKYISYANLQFTCVALIDNNCKLYLINLCLL